MAKKNMLVIVGAVVAVAALGGSGFLLYTGFRNLTQNRSQLKSAVGKLQSYAESDPYPSQASIDQQRTNVKTLQAELARLIAQIQVNQTKIEPLQPSAFIDLLGSKMTKYRALALKQKVSIPASYAFGFDKYCERGSELPASDSITNMTEQLEVLEEITRILCEASVQEIIKVGREEIEAKSSDDTTPKETSEPPSTADASNVVKFVSYEGELYTKLFFTVEFKAKEAALIRVLNKFSAAKAFIVVNSMTVEKEGEDVARHEPTAPALVIASDESGEADDAPGASDGTVEKAAVPLRKNRIVCGAEVEKPMKINLVIEAYRFIDKKASEAGKEEAAK
jgi:hypothetical protein